MKLSLILFLNCIMFPLFGGKIIVDSLWVPDWVAEKGTLIVTGPFPQHGFGQHAEQFFPGYTIKGPFSIGNTSLNVEGADLWKHVWISIISESQVQRVLLGAEFSRRCAHKGFVLFHWFSSCHIEFSQSLEYELPRDNDQDIHLEGYIMNTGIQFFAKN